MKTLIVYDTRHGATEYSARRLVELLEDGADTVRLRKGVSPDLSPYQAVLIGSPVYTGRLLKEVTEFCRQNLDELLEKRIGLFICCITPLREAEKYLENLFPGKLFSSACATGVFGGVFDFRQMSRVERFMIRRVKKVRENMSTLSEENIALFARALDEICRGQ